MNDLERTIEFFKSFGVRDIKVVQHEHYQSLRFGHHHYSDDEIIDLGPSNNGFPGFNMQFKFSLDSGELITMGVWE